MHDFNVFWMDDCELTSETLSFDPIYNWMERGLTLRSSGSERKTGEASITRGEEDGI